MKNILNKLKGAEYTALLGIDGMVDEVWEIIDKRNSPTDVVKMEKLLSFGEVITERRTGGIAKERLLKRRSSGGFVANTGRAVAKLGVSSTFLGMFEPLDKVFYEFNDIATLIPVGSPIYMNILEFSDGKLMMPHLNELLNLKWEDIVLKLGEDRLKDIFSVDIVGVGYWSNLFDFDNILREICALAIENKKTKYVFHDFANLNKRTLDDLGEAIEVLKRENKRVPQILSLNKHEGILLAKYLGFEVNENPDEFKSLVSKMREKLYIHEFLVHTLDFSIIATEDECEITYQKLCEKPTKTTGAGDTFNGAYMAAKLVEEDAQKRLQFANAVAYHYVETGDINILEKDNFLCTEGEE